MKNIINHYKTISARDLSKIVGGTYECVIPGKETIKYEDNTMSQKNIYDCLYKKHGDLYNRRN